jgi:hypothetical protein
MNVFNHKHICLVLLGLSISLLGGCRSPQSSESQSSLADDRQIVASQSEHLQKVEVTGKVRVYRLLREDDEGARHEKFLVLLSNGTTVMIAHSIDEAPPVPVHPGDDVTIHGEYIWNQKGGVIHWTHHSDSPRHEGGWIEFQGQRYQ